MVCIISAQPMLRLGSVYCLTMGVDHYENFPVASLWLPAALRPAVRHLYAFARGADDLADEGDNDRTTRHADLARWRLAIQALFQPSSTPPELNPDEQLLFERLGSTIRAHHLPPQPFLDLLSAFEQDLHQTHYANEMQLLDYCRRSANPVGRLMLHLFDARSPMDIAQSDALCTGLQRVNFCQDIAVDHAKGRCYVPLDCLRRHGARLAELDSLCQAPPAGVPAHWKAVLQEQCELARRFLLAGSPLAWRLKGRVGWELRLVVHGGLRILEKLAQGGYNPFANRPIIHRRDTLLLCWRAMRRPRTPLDDQSPFHDP